MKAILFLFIGLFSGATFAVDGKDVLKKIRKNYEDLTTCSADLRYAIYRGFDSSEPVETYDGYLCRNGKDSYRKIHNAEYLNLYSSGIHLQLDHRDKSMYLANAVDETLFEADLEKSLKRCGNIVTQTTSDGLSISLILNKTHDLPYNRIDIRVSENFYINAITLYYAAKANFSTNYHQPDMDAVKMEIRYVNFETKWEDTDGKLNASRYLNLTNTVYEPTALYQNYSIVDLRK